MGRGGCWSRGLEHSEPPSWGEGVPRAGGLEHSEPSSRGGGVEGVPRAQRGGTGAGAWSTVSPHHGGWGDGGGAWSTVSPHHGRGWPAQL